MNNLLEQDLRILEKRYHKDEVIKQLQKQRYDILSLAVPIAIHYHIEPIAGYGCTFVYDEAIQQRLDFLEKQLWDYTMENYLKLLAKE